ncbi:MAG TPA: maleylpyruvate isomerase family mycothiol-dependent enzyme [Streptomyces sp.]|nr:maleylpyruvate isomerase family mycothiol-dependent enzyme [Streptomyces sp.]
MTANHRDDHPAALLPLLRSSAESLLKTANALTGEEVHAPSSLPGWTRAHVLTHLARGADSRVRLLTSARTGADLPQYPDEQTRAREIDQGARRDADAVRVDLAESLEQVLSAVAHHPDDAWDTPVQWLATGPRPVRGVATSLLRELEVHHVDLAADYTPEDWPPRFVALELPLAVRQLRRDPQMPSLRLRADEDQVVHPFGDGRDPMVTGRAAALLGWLTGRSDGRDLTVEPAAPLPVIPAWKR